MQEKDKCLPRKPYKIRIVFTIALPRGDKNQMDNLNLRVTEGWYKQHDEVPRSMTGVQRTDTGIIARLEVERAADVTTEQELKQLVDEAKQQAANFTGRFDLARGQVKSDCLVFWHTGRIRTVSDDERTLIKRLEAIGLKVS